MVVTTETIVTIAAVITAVGVIFGVIFKAYKLYLKQFEQDAAIKKLKEKTDKDMKRIQTENTLICFALSACLDGLSQLGANHTVPIAREKLDNYLNTAAHDVNSQEE